MSVIRISLGRFSPESCEKIKRMLDESQNTLIPAIRTLSGNIAYFVGIDEENNTMTNVSIWETIEDAKQMASLKAMADLGKLFVESGVQFERPITNHQALWQL